MSSTTSKRRFKEGAYRAFGVEDLEEAGRDIASTLREGTTRWDEFQRIMATARLAISEVLRLRAVIAEMASQIRTLEARLEK